MEPKHACITVCIVVVGKESIDWQSHKFFGNDVECDQFDNSEESTFSFSFFLCSAMVVTDFHSSPFAFSLSLAQKISN